MNKFLVILFILGLFACNQETKKTTKFFFIALNKHNQIDTQYIIQNYDYKGGLKKVELNFFHKKTKKNIANYVICDSLKKYEYYWNNEKISDFYLAKDTMLRVRDTLFLVQIFVLNEGITDGGSVHYFTTKHGIFMTHSITWPAIKLIGSTDSIDNLEKLLLEKKACTQPKFFFRGKLKNIFDNIND